MQKTLPRIKPLKARCRKSKIQKSRLTFVFAILALCFVPLLMSCQSKQIPASSSPLLIQETGFNGEKDLVVLLHGMYRDARAMKALEKYLERLNYEVTNISYPSTEYPIETLAEDYLGPALAALKIKKDRQVHFVTHSMGGILVRYYLKQHPLDSIGNVVMIAPPNKGTELADFLVNPLWTDTNKNPAKFQLGSEVNSWVNQLGPVNFSLGVIAGDLNNNFITDWIVSGKDDGVVSVESTKVLNMSDFITVREKHYRLRANQTVMQQVAYFLQYKQF